MYTVGILGAGSIGAMKPDHIDSPATNIPLTHAHAVYSNEGFKLLWIYDKYSDKMKNANHKWGSDGKLALNPVDVLVIATPTEGHLEEVQKICMASKENRPRMIVLEKPAGINIHHATKIDYLTRELGIKVVVNYGRRFNSAILKAAESINRREKLQNITFYYTRGFIRDGSHAIDMLNLFAGTFIDGYLFPKPIIDWSEADPTYGAKLEYSKCPSIYLLPVDGREYDVFEMHIKTNETCWSFVDHFKKIQFTYKRKEETYGDYFSMPAPDGNYWETDLEYSLKVLYEKIFEYLFINETPEPQYTPTTICGMKEAIRVHAVINRLMIKKQIEEGDKE